MFRKITLFSLILALIVVVSGAFAHLSDQGLGCPDWPGCYGQLVIRGGEAFKAQADLAFPEHPFDIAKAWREMSHRYLIASLSLFILLLGGLAWKEKQNRLAAMIAASGLLFLVGSQFFLDLWVVKTQAEPVVITGLMLSEMMTFWLLFRLYLRSNPTISVSTVQWKGLLWLARFSMLVLLSYIVLVIWIGADHANYEYRGYPGYWHETRIFTETGVIAFDDETAVQWLYSAGALACLGLLTLLVVLASLAKYPRTVRKAGLVLGLLVLVQVSLNAVGYKLDMPFWVSVANSACAALLMLPLIALSFYSRYGFKDITEAPVEFQPQQEVGAAGIPIGVEVIQPYVEPAPESLYLRLKSQLKRTRSGLGDLLANLSVGQKESGDDLLEDLEASLLMADIGITVTTEIISRLTQHLDRQQLKDPELLSAALKQELLRILKPCSKPLQIPKQDKPFVILIVGVNGAGKTTTIGKLAKRLQVQGHSVMLAAGDTFRAAAVEQLQTWGERNSIHVVAQHTGADSASVIYDGVQSAQAKGIDVLIADTAGRLHTKSNLMDELKKVKRIIGKLDETAPHEVLLVLDAGTGQNALSQAKLFNETVALTGLVLTKLDGTAKGGVIFALAGQSGIPIRYIGIGEGIDDLQDFDAETFVDALFVKD
ncbi:MAG: signal recognition particle-docking protein FtsY [Methylovulum sp.]|nr:MAG: signal recognition particle-docking protein FtsY [Methylovulum sp.]